MHIDTTKNPSIGYECRHGQRQPMISIPVIREFTGMDAEATRTWLNQLGHSHVQECGDALYMPANRILQFLVEENHPPMDPHQALEMLTVKLTPYVERCLPNRSREEIYKAIHDAIAIDAAINNQSFATAYDISAPLAYTFKPEYDEGEVPSSFNFDCIRNDSPATLEA